MLLPIEACSQSRVYTEQLLHTEAFTQREAFAQRSLYNLIRTETLNTQIFTHRGICTQVLHTDAADASTHRSFWAQMLFHTEAFTQRRFDIYTPIHTEAFRHRWFVRESQKPWHREAFTERIFYTQKLLHTQAFPQIPQKLLHRESFWAQELLHTDVFTHRSLYTRRLLRPEAFTQRSLYTHTDAFPQKKTIPQSSFYTFQKIAILRKFLTFGHHIVQKGCIRRWTIILRERVAPDLVKSQFYTSFISRETVVPDVPKWI